MKRAKAVHHVFKNKTNSKSEFLGNVMTAKDIHSKITKKHEKKAEDISDTSTKGAIGGLNSVGAQGLITRKNMENKYIEKVAKDSKPSLGYAANEDKRRQMKALRSAVSKGIIGTAIGAGTGAIAKRLHLGAIANKLPLSERRLDTVKNLKHTNIGAAAGGTIGASVGYTHGSAKATQELIEKERQKGQEKKANIYLEKIANKKDGKPGYGEATKTVAKATGRGFAEGLGSGVAAGALGAGAGLLALKTRTGAKLGTALAKQVTGGKTSSAVKRQITALGGALPLGYAAGTAGAIHGNIASTKKSLEKQYEKGQEKKANIYLEKIAAEKWIQKAIKHPGALHRKLGVPEGEKIPAAKLEAATHKPGKLGQEARLAETLKSFHKKAEEEKETKKEEKEEKEEGKGEEKKKEDSSDKKEHSSEDCSTEKQAGILSAAVGAAKTFGKGVAADAPKVGEQLRNIGAAYRANKGFMNKGTLSTVKALGKNRAVQAGAGTLGAGIIAGKMMSSGQNKQAEENVYLNKVAQMFGGFNLPKPPVPTMTPSTLGIRG